MTLDPAATLRRKLGLAAHHRVLLDRPPEGWSLGEVEGRLLRRLPAGGAPPLDVVLTFHTHRSTLGARLPALLDATALDGMVWVCWPKLRAQKDLSIRSDLSDAVVRSTGLDLGWVDVKVAAIDDVWSGLKFVRRLADRRPPPDERPTVDP